jgi:hypothetical protein
MVWIGRLGCVVALVAPIALVLPFAWSFAHKWAMDDLRANPSRVAATRPIVVSSARAVVDADVAFDGARREVEVLLPGAHYRGMVVRSRCGDVAELRGRLVFDFVRGGPPSLVLRIEPVETATVVVDSERQQADIDVTDATAFYSNPLVDVFPGHAAINRVAVAAQERLVGLGITACDVNLTQTADDRWSVSCVPAVPVGRRCGFRVRDGEPRALVEEGE